MVFMKSAAIVRLIFLAVLLQPIAGFGFETDQYNLPPVPLADIGVEVSEYVEENVRKAALKLNAEIIYRQECIDDVTPRNNKCSSRAADLSRLNYLRSEAAIAREVYRGLGAGIIATTKSGTWMDSHTFRSQPARYKSGFRNSIFLIVPTNYLTISPTVNLYGTLLGTDKIAHVFQQGYTYYTIYNKAIASGLTPDAASKKAVSWGRLSENTYYGTLVSGVFSNADLYANYAGLKFYQGLTQPIRIGENTRSPTLLIKDGVWILNEISIQDNSLIKPFFTDHMNEALNPSIFFPGLRSFVRKVVKKQNCPAWRKTYPKLTAANFEASSKDLELWNGEDYGFKSSRKFVTIANTCFGPDAYLPTSSLASSVASYTFRRDSRIPAL